MTRTIGVWGAVATIIGFVVGVSIFLLPGELAGIAGPAVVLAYGVASLIAIFSCVVAAQIGAVFPVSGASFVCLTRVVSPFLGFAQVWLVISGVSIAIALVAYGFADYFSLLFPAADRTVAAAGIIVALCVLNLMGSKTSVSGQGIMVVVLMSVLIVFCAGGYVHMDTTLLTPFIPNGIGSIFIAAIPAFFSYAGFMMIIELGGEIKYPSRNIPLALLISFLVVWLSYSLVSVVLVGMISWQELARMPAPVGEAASRIFPGWTSQVIVVSVLAAAASTINGLLLGYSRDILALGRSGIFPEAFARRSENYGVPLNAVLLLSSVSLVALSLGKSILEYATVVVLVIMLSQILLGFAVIRIPKRLPDEFATAEFRLGKLALFIFGGGLIVGSGSFFIISWLDNARAVTAVIFILLVGAIFYFFRIRYLTARGISINKSAFDESATLANVPRTNQTF